MIKIIFVAAFVTVMMTSNAFAETKCNTKPLDETAADALAQLSNEFNWTISKMKIDDGCYELHVTDEDGNVLKVKIDPETMDVVAGKVKKWGDGTPVKEKKNSP